jgi:hypothetical protein
MNLGQYIAKALLEHDVDEVNHQTTDDVFTALVAKEGSEIERTAQEFNIPLEDLKYAFIAGRMIILSDDIWSKLENTDSYDITSIEDAVKLANQYGKKWKSTLSAIKNSEVLDPPMVLNYDKSRYYLVGGNTRLMFYKALGITPKVLLATIDIPKEKEFYLTEDRLTESQTGTIGEFIKFAAKNLGIQNLPGSLTLSYDNKQAQDKRTFGFFDPHDKKIWIYVKNRNMADILRTLAHELVHRKQEEDGKLDIKSGETGSPIEDEANATAGVLLRNFGKINNGIYEGLKKKPINELDFNLNRSYDWKFEGGTNNRYTFTTGQTNYEVFYAPKKEANTYERSFRPVDEDNMFVGSVPLTPVNEFKVLEVYATVMETTIDFLNKNKDWRKVIISPIEKRRYNIVKGFLEKHLPKNYFIDEEDEIFYIYRKTK